MITTLVIAVLVVGATLTTAAVHVPGPGGQALPPALVAPLENVHDPLQRALQSLMRAANQSCDIKRAIVDVKLALREVSASQTFLAAHHDARVTSPLPPDVTPDFTVDTPPARQRNLMINAALRDLERSFQRLAHASGGSLDGHRDVAYHRIADAAAHLKAAVVAANTAFARGTREVADCEPGADLGS